jgi:hypothetical protein
MNDPIIHYADPEDMEHGYYLGRVDGDPQRCCPHCGSDRLWSIDADSHFVVFSHPWYAEWYRCLKCDREFVLGTPFPPGIVKAEVLGGGVLLIPPGMPVRYLSQKEYEAMEI